MPPHLGKIQVKYEPFKGLGVWFSSDSSQTLELNFTERLKKMEKILQIWKQRKLSLKGKITILKTLVLPQIQFLFALLYVSENTLKHVDNMLFGFLWDKKPAKIKRDTIIAPIDEGGLGMIDVYAVHTTAKCSWISRLLSKTDSKWKTLTWKMLNIPKFILNKNFEYSQIYNGKTNFHQQLLSSWHIVSTHKPTKVTQILNQYLMYNQYIC